MGYLSQVVRDTRPRPVARSFGLAAPVQAATSEPLTYARLMESRPAPTVPPAPTSPVAPASDAPGTPAPLDDREDDLTETAPAAARPDPNPPAAIAPRVTQPALSPRTENTAPGRSMPMVDTPPTSTPASSVPGTPGAAAKAAPARLAAEISAAGSPRPPETVAEVITPRVSAAVPATQDVPPPAIAQVSAAAEAGPSGTEATPTPISPEVRVPTQPAPTPIAAQASAPDTPTEVRIGQVEIIVQEPAAPRQRPTRSSQSAPISPSRFHVRRL